MSQSTVVTASQQFASGSTSWMHLMFSYSFLYPQKLYNYIILLQGHKDCHCLQCIFTKEWFIHGPIYVEYIDKKGLSVFRSNIFSYGPEFTIIIYLSGIYWGNLWLNVTHSLWYVCLFFWAIKWQLAFPNQNGYYLKVTGVKCHYANNFCSLVQESDSHEIQSITLSTLIILLCGPIHRVAYTYAMSMND